MRRIMFPGAMMVGAAMAAMEALATHSPLEEAHRTRAKAATEKAKLPKPENPEVETRQMRRARERAEFKRLPRK